MPRELRLSMFSVSFASRSVSAMMRRMYFACSSGGMVPSKMASEKPLIEVKGERKSWDTFAIKRRSSSSRRESFSAMLSMVLAR